MHSSNSISYNNIGLGLAVLLLCISICNSLLARVTGLPMGILLDLLIGLSLAFVLFRSDYIRKRNLCINLIIIWFIYCSSHLILHSTINHASVGAFRNYAFRFLSLPLFLYITAYRSSVVKLVVFISVINLIFSTYGLIQHYIGFPDWDMSYIYASQGRTELFTHFNLLRIISVFSDPTTLGNYSCIMFAMTVLLIPLVRKARNKILFGLVSLLLISNTLLAYSRTPYLLLAIGAMIFVVFTLETRRLLTTIGLAILIAIPLLTTNNPLSSRIKSAFDFKNNVSLQIRNTDRHYVQEFIHSKPYGIGMGQTGFYSAEQETNDFLSKFQANNGYLKLAIELGWVSFVLYLLLFLTIALYGLSIYNNLEGISQQSAFLAFYIPLLMLIIANFPQETIIRNPFNVLVCFFIAMVTNIKTLVKE